MKITFFSAEVAPFAKTGGLADVCGALPLALEKLGHDINIFMPGYRSIDHREHPVKRLNTHVSMTMIGHHIGVYFIEHASFSDRDGLYGDAKGDYPDNLDRFQFFCLKSLQVAKQLNVSMEILHCHDWQTALIPVYLRSNLSKDEYFKGLKTVYTIHNLAYQGNFSKDQFDKLGVDGALFSTNGLEFYDKINLMKGGILFADEVTTVSPQYAQEIQTEQFGCGLHGVLQSRSKNIFGVLNGIDPNVWDPRNDPLITHQFSGANLAGKAANKKELQKSYRLPEKENVPLIGSVGRLSHQKGIDLLLESADKIFEADIQMAILGVGEERYHTQLKKLQERFPDKLAVHLQFNEQFAHQIYAGSDFFLMPSVYEPCGLSQMISLAYGTIPVVFRTGGLVDTIVPYTENGNGIMFSEYTVPALCHAVRQAMDLYQDQAAFTKLVQKAFTYDFSWTESARHYVDMYRECLTVGQV